MSSVDTAFLRCLTTQIDGLSDFLPTSTAQGVFQVVRQTKRSAQAHIVQPQMCQRERESFHSGRF